MVTLGTLTSNDTTATRMNLRSFSLHSGYFYPRALSNVDGPSWSWISSDHIQAQKEEYNFVVASLRPSKNEKLGIFTSQSCISGKEMYRKGMMALAKLLFCFLNLLFFWRSRYRPRRWILKSLIFSLPRLPSSLPKLPNNSTGRTLTDCNWHGFEKSVNITTPANHPTRLFHNFSVK